MFARQKEKIIYEFIAIFHTETETYTILYHTTPHNICHETGTKNNSSRNPFFSFLFLIFHSNREQSYSCSPSISAYFVASQNEKNEIILFKSFG